MFRRFKRAALAALFAFAFVFPSLVAPASATDRVQWLFSMNPPSSWWNYMQRYPRLGEGTLLWNLLGGATGGLYANLSVVATSGLTIAVQPSASNTLGTVYQFLPEETNTFGGPGSTALAADPTQVYLQGQVPAGGTAPLTGATLTPPGTAGQSIDYLVECQVQTVDTTSQTITLVTPQGQQTTESANRDRKDIAACQTKAGTAATTGSQTVPSADAGWVGIGFVPVANGATTISGITMLSTNLFAGFALLNGSGLLSVAQGGTGSATQNFVDLTTTQTIGGAKTFSTAPTLSGIHLTAGTVSIGSGGAQTGVLPVANGGTGSASQNFVDLTTTQTVGGAKTFSSLITASAGVASASTVKATSNGSTQGFLAPVYNASGAALAGTTHTVVGSISGTVTSTCIAGTSCAGTALTITLSGAAQFSSGGVCTMTDAAGEQLFDSILTAPVLTNIQFELWNGSDTTVSSGTAYAENYICTGA